MQRQKPPTFLINLRRWGILFAVVLACFTVLSPRDVRADGEVIYYEADGCYDVKSFGVGMFGTGAGNVTVSVPGEVVDAFIYWVGVEDDTPAGDGTSILEIGNGVLTEDVVGTLFPGAAGLATRPNPDWYGWYADIGPNGAGLVTQPGAIPLSISGWDSANEHTNGATIAIVYSTGECATPRRVVLKAGVDAYFWQYTNERFTELLIYQFPAVPEARVASVRFAHAGMDSTATSCRGGAIWMLAGSGSPPDAVTFDLVEGDPVTQRGFGINGGVEIVNDAFTGPALPCTPTVNPAPDEAYEPGHPYPGGAQSAPYRSLGIDPPVGGNIGPEWGILEVELLIPANATWVAFQLESEADQRGESGSWAGGGFLVPSPQLAVLKYNDANGDGVFTDLEEAPSDNSLVTFKVVIANTTVDPLTITNISDDLHGANAALTTASNLAPACADVLGTVLEANQSITCYFDGTISVGNNNQEVDTVTVTATAGDNTTHTAYDTSTVVIPGALPAIAVEKVADPLSLPEPGGVFTFTVTVTNTVQEALTLTTLVDDIHGNLNGQGTCSVPQQLAVGGAYTCQFPATVTGTAGYTETDTVTATAQDGDGNSANASDDATVTITPPVVLPAIAVEKVADPLSLPEPGGVFTFTVTVTNTVQEALTLTNLVDDIHGNLNGQGTCSVPQQIAVGGAYTCQFPATVTGTAGYTETDTVMATAQDSDGNSANASDDATVTITPLPAIAILKTLDLSGDAADGIVTVGQSLTYTIRVTNTSPVTLTVVPLSDTYDSTYLAYRRATPTPDDASTPGTILWNDLTGAGVLPPQGAIDVAVTFDALASTDSLPGKQTINVALVDGATDGTTTLPPVVDDAPVRITDPRVLVTKTTTDPADGVVDLNGLVTFTIAISNTGDTILDILPVNDTFIPAELSYVRSSLTTAPQVSDGALFWSDVSTELGNLAPGASVSFTVTFRFISQTATATVNTVVLGEVIDENGDAAGQPQGQSDTSTVTKSPTAITLLSFGAIAHADGVQVRWVTGAEIDVLGFHLRRGSSVDRTEAVRITDTMIAARGAGGQGASYSYTDSDPVDGDVYYWLEEVSMTGERIFHGPVMVQQEDSSPLQDIRLYLPVLTQ